MDTLTVSGGRQYCECTVSATSVPGPFSPSLYCNISNNEDSHTLHIKGHTQVLYDTHVYTCILQNACTCIHVHVHVVVSILDVHVHLHVLPTFMHYIIQCNDVHIVL